MTIKEAQDAVDKWIKQYGVRYFSELTNMACLTEEVGELARVIARTYGDQSFKREKTQPWRRNGRCALGTYMSGKSNGCRPYRRASKELQQENPKRCRKT